LLLSFWDVCGFLLGVIMFRFIRIDIVVTVFARNLGDEDVVCLGRPGTMEEPSDSESLLEKGERVRGD